MDVTSFLLGLAKGKASAGGGGSATHPIHTVTFDTEDGSAVLYQRSVVDGDDCADVVARGLLETPTKESTPQYSYTNSGWSLTPEGSADADALDAVTADRTVYAAFTSAVRYYTITYYDEDGTTVLNTQSLKYGAMPSYVPVKTGYTFNGWSPELATVTGDASYTAAWIAKMDFNALTWAQIAEYAESGNAHTLFELGAEKTFNVNGSNVVAKIIGFNHDDLADGSGKAGITIALQSSFDVDKPKTSYDSQNTGAYFDGAITTKEGTYWNNSYLHEWWNGSTFAAYSIRKYLPSALMAVIKEVSKKVWTPSGEVLSPDTIWLPSISELGFTDGKDEGDCYEAYTNGKTSGNTYPELVKNIAGTDVEYFTRSKYANGYNIQSISNTGQRTTENQGTSSGTYPHFCI